MITELMLQKTYMHRWHGLPWAKDLRIGWIVEQEGYWESARVLPLAFILDRDGQILVCLSWMYLFAEAAHIGWPIHLNNGSSCELAEARKGDWTVLITCDEDNEASRLTILSTWRQAYEHNRYATE